MARTSTSHAIVLFLIHLALPSSAQPELDALLRLKASVTNNAIALSDWTAPVCGLHLQNMGLEGAIDVLALAQLPNFKVLSNSFAGPLPNLAALPNVRVVSLSNNEMSGAIPADAFVGMTALVQLYLDNNGFSGEMQELMLQNNMFQGGLPRFREGQLKKLSVANNDLAGEIPPGLSHSDSSSFLGNKDLCGTPLLRCPNQPRKLSIGTMLMMSVVVAAALVALVTVILILCRR